MPRARHTNRLLILIVPLTILLLPYLLDLTPQHSHDENEGALERMRLDLTGGCDIFRGSWVYDESYPLYSSCRILEQGFRCQENGRPDQSYTKWRWKPSQCELPSFNAKLMLKKLRNKRVAFVGDSMGRTQWESLICMLLTGVEDGGGEYVSPVFEVNNRTITKRAPYLAFHFAAHNLTIEYHRSPFLVQEGRPPKHSPRRVRWAVKLDKVDHQEKRWREANVLVFNTGHWWNPSKTYQIGTYFYVSDSVRMGMKLENAYHAALNTWASWVEELLSDASSKTHVLFRSLEPAHWDGSKKRCLDQRAPNATQRPPPPPLVPYNRILDRVVQGMSKNVTLLNITALSEVRSDAHIGKWSRGHPPLDCSHWCLPGVPDTWNQLLYLTLLTNNDRISE